MNCIGCELARAKLRVFVMRGGQRKPLEEIIERLNTQLTQNYYLRTEHLENADIHHIERLNKLPPNDPYLIYKEEVNHVQPRRINKVK